MATPHRSVLRKLHLENVEQLSTPLKIPASPFMKSLGYGTGVSVYRLDRSPRGTGQGRSPWAIKRVARRIQETDTTNSKLFNTRILVEADILRKLSHPNIVGFRAVKQGEDGIDTLAIECCSTSLGTLLEERCDAELGALPAENILKMVEDISQALDYLHTEAFILHGDLKSYNILVKGDFEICKLCDFGVSLPLDKEGCVDFKKNPDLHYVGTSLWSAPEVIDDSDVIDCKADIFSFGLVIYETIALVPPHTLGFKCHDDSAGFDSSLNESKDNTFDESAMSRDADEDDIENACGTRPPLPQAFHLSEDYNCIVELFYCCTNELAEDRPMAKTIWESLQQRKHKQ